METSPRPGLCLSHFRSIARGIAGVLFRSFSVPPAQIVYLFVVFYAACSCILI